MDRSSVIYMDLLELSIFFLSKKNMYLLELSLCWLAICLVACIIMIHTFPFNFSFQSH